MIYLTGFMGAGKTTIAKALAKQLALPFYDTDQLIEEQEGKDINSIFKNDGELHFRTLEKEILESINKKSIVACGGGLPIYNNNIQLLNKKGTSIYLKASTSTLVSHLKNQKNNRPLLKNKTNNELEEHINTMLSTRENIYLKAKYTINTDNKSKDEIVEEILALELSF